MIRLFSVEFWMVILFFINFSLAFFVFVFIRRMNRLRSEQVSQTTDEEGVDGDVRNTASDIMDMLEPLVKESREAAILFDEQIKDKKRLLKGLNDALDSRIININLLLSRADAMQKNLEERQSELNKVSLSREGGADISSGSVADQQNRILSMYHRKYDIDTIAQELSIPRGEVQLVIELKKKFLEMEKNSR